MYFKNLSTSFLVEKISEPSGTGEITSSSDPDMNNSSSSPEHVPSYSTSVQDVLKTLYSSGLFIHSSLKEKLVIKYPWPPTSESFTIDHAHEVVPDELYNIITWIVGASVEPTMGDLDVPEEIQLKVLSICQDIVYLASGGRRQTPKSLALDLTVRHLTGPHQVLSILNNLGHTASTDAIFQFETSLAQLQILKGNNIPPGFSKDKPTILV